MTYTNDQKEQHLDQLYEWVEKEKWSDIMDYCAGEVSTLDDDLPEAVEYYIENNLDKLWSEYFNSISI